MTAIREDHPLKIKIITGPFGTGKVNKYILKGKQYNETFIFFIL